MAMIIFLNTVARQGHDVIGTLGVAKGPQVGVVMAKQVCIYIFIFALESECSHLNTIVMHNNREDQATWNQSPALIDIRMKGSGLLQNSLAVN